MTDPLADFVRSELRRRAADVERVCEQMLTDPRGWGVLEHDYGTAWEVELSPMVDFGYHHIHKAATRASCKGCESEIYKGVKP